MTAPTTATRCPECLGSGVFRCDFATNRTIPCHPCRGSGVGPAIAVNPGTGSVEEATVEDACVNVAALVLEVAQRRGATFTVRVSPEPPRDGRWLFELTLVTERRTVRMPGLPLERVRFTGEAGQDAWDYPRLYVDGSSWLWLYAVSMLSSPPEEDDD